MKKLDEVIKTFEDCFGNGRIVISPLEVEPDYGAAALQYLKEYRDQMNDLDEALHFLGKQVNEVIEEASYNPPLTWDELKGMEGKAIWAEYEEYKAWHIIESFNYNPYYGGDRILFTDDAMFLKKDMGEKWKAYRKERE